MTCQDLCMTCCHLQTSDLVQENSDTHAVHVWYVEARENILHCITIWGILIKCPWRSMSLLIFKLGKIHALYHSEQCWNWLELYLISLLVNFSRELGQIMTRYDFLWDRWVILSNVQSDLNFLCELGQIMSKLSVA